MEKPEFKLPKSSLPELKKILIAYAKAKSASSLDDISALTGIYRTTISTNNGFLESIGAIEGASLKEPTTIGKNLGLAIANNIETEISANLQVLLLQTEFIDSMNQY